MILRSLFIGLSLLILINGVGPVFAADELFPVRLVSLLTTDDSGLPIDFPIYTYFDTPSSETYVISSTGRITVYDKDFFPITSFGKGRGLSQPRSLVIDGKGNIYVCQGYSSAGVGVSPRVTIYNQAFFPIREIVFADVPGLEKFVPNRIAINRAGEIYLVGTMDQKATGALVLDREGQFSHWLRPKDFLFRPPPLAEPDQADTADQDLPAPLKPVVYTHEQWGEQPDEKQYPVFLDDIDIDKNGRIYLMSREVSRIYVFDASEKQLFRFGTKGGSEGKLSNAMGVAVDPDRRVIAVVDYMRHTILFYDYDYGSYIYESGGRGRAPLWYNFPNDIEISSQGHIIVSDLFNQRVQVIGIKMMDERIEPIAAPVVLGELTQPGLAEELPQLLTPAFTAPAPINPVGIGKIGVPPNLPIILSGPVEISPTRFKKAIPLPEIVHLKLPPEPPGAENFPVRLPARMELLAETAQELANQEAIVLPGGAGQPNSISVTLMVYGPVVALVGLGSWLLKQR